MSGVPHGELAVCGPMLFREYWGRPEATAAAFDAEGYFLTGDTVSLEGDPPYYKVKLLAAAVQAEAWGGGSIVAAPVWSLVWGCRVLPDLWCGCMSVLCCVVFVQILGRTSVDIIKSGGYKLSALDIESALLHHPGVAEAAVLGVPHDELGQVVTALIYPKQQGAGLDASANQQLVAQLQELCGRELPAYSVPRQWVLLDAPLPSNAMGKVNKKELLKNL